MMTSQRQLLFTFIPTTAVLVLVAAVSERFHINISLMTRDVASLGGVHPLAGFLSSLGVMLWTVAAAVCFFAAVVIRNHAPSHDSNFLFFSGALSSYLMLDDLYQFHEELALSYLGVDDGIIYLILGVAVVIYLLRYRRRILETRFDMLIASMLLLGLSVVLDTVLEAWVHQFGHWRYYAEDGAKWLGIAAWCSYFANTSYQLVHESLGRSDDPG